MGQTLLSQVAKVAAGSANRTPEVAPAGTTSVVLNAQTDCWVQISTGDQTPFRAERTLTFTRNPVAGEIWQMGTAPGGVAYTWVASGATGNQVNVGATLALSLGNLVVKMNAAGFDCSVAGSAFTALAPVASAIGPQQDGAWVAYGQPYLTDPIGTALPFKAAGAMFLAASDPPAKFPAAPGQNVWTLGATGVVTNALGLAVTWEED